MRDLIYALPSRDFPFIRNMEHSGQITETEEEIPVEDESHVDDSETLRDEENFIHNVAQFYNEKSLSDVTIVVGEKRYYGHKFVLAKSSEVFKLMLYGDSWSKGNESDIVLSESTECQAVFDLFLKFMYTAEVNITVETAVGILCLADKYNVTSLKELCIAYMVKNTTSPKVLNALHWYNWAKALHLESLIESCTKTIAWNIDSIVDTPDWINMDQDFMCDILSNSELVVADEYTLYEGLQKWLMHDSRRSELRSNTNRLLPLIRFPQLLVDQLYSIETSDFFNMEETANVMIELIGRAYRFRSLCPYQHSLSLSFEDQFYRPRNYMSLAVDSVRMQNSLRFGIQVDVKTYSGPVVSEVRNGEWKITYRKQDDCWTIQLYCHESACIKGQAYIETSVLVFNENEKVIQVDSLEATAVTRSKGVGLSVNLLNPEESKSMVLLIKPVPY